MADFRHFPLKNLSKTRAMENTSNANNGIGRHLGPAAGGRSGRGGAAVARRHTAGQDDLPIASVKQAGWPPLSIR